MTFAEQIRQQCARNGSRPAMSFGIAGPNTINYDRLGYCIRNVAARLAARGVVPGGIYGVLHRDTLTHVAVLLALEQLGAVTVSLAGASMAQHLEMTAVVSGRDLPDSRCPVFRVGEDWLSAPDPSAPPAPMIAYAPDGICRIAFTSGSTGQPKPVAEKAAWLAKRNTDQDLAFGPDFARFTRRLCCVGLNVLFGYRMLIRTLAEGGLFSFPDTDFARSVRGMALHDVQTLIASPTQLIQYADYGEANPGAYPSLKMIVCGGARLSTVVAERLRRHVCPRVMFAYGSSEGGIIAAGPAETLDLDRGEVGRALPGIEVEIVDDATGQPVVGVKGRVRMRGESVMRSYYGGANQEGYFEGEWFYPGDVGMLSENGMLSILGRKDNLVSIGGESTTVETVEAQLLRAPGLKDITAIPMPDAPGQICAFAVPRDGWSEKAFWEYCHVHVDRRFWPAKLIALKELPRGTSGKVDRQRLAALL